ncbi:phage tail tube protein [Thaumasiovibrio subtropicus]|uniref:phage tail tube protein n=1 Tax=Thaumasiovibrio subtropicus TaxID=1891207 RepID=UPI000B35B271|nr:phage tail tube protein [Thaumasiovibrio subtropicus]
MSRKAKKKILMFAPETNYGVDPIAGGSEPSFILGREFSIVPQAGESLALDYDTGELGNSPEIMTECYVEVEFGIDFASKQLTAEGTIGEPAPWSPLLDSCLRKTVTEENKTRYLINDTSSDSLTLYYYQSGTLHKVTGARGTVALSLQAKQFPTLKFKFTGLHSVPESAEHPTPDFSHYQTPLKVGVENSAFTIDGTPHKMVSLEIDQANSVIHQEYVGHEEVMITDFAPTATLIMEAPDLNTLDPFALAKAGKEHTIAFTNGPIGNQIGWQSQKVQFGRPSYADQDGTQTYSIPLRLIGGSDEIFNC